VNWGNSPFPSGIAISGGANIPVLLADTYEVTFNDITGDYCFAAVSYADPQKRSVRKDLTNQKGSGASIFPAEAKDQEIFSNGEDFLEGPVISPDSIFYFSDFIEQTKTGIIWMLNQQTGAYKVFRSPSGMANGHAFDRKGDGSLQFRSKLLISETALHRMV
jgi:hypothetical protein